MNTKISCRTYMAWDYDKEEEHLDEMSEKGWQLKKGGCFFSVYTRQPGVVYRNRIDYNPDAVNSPEEKRRYLELFEEQGWEYVGNTYNGWIYFKKKYVPGTPEEEYEIYTDADGEVIFKKYSPIGELSSFTGQYAEVLSRSTNLPVLICDRDHVIACAGIPKREAVDRRISANLESLMEKRSNFVYSGSGESLRPVEGLERMAGIAYPIIGSGDVSGAVVLLMAENGATAPSSTEIKLMQVAASFLGKQMEE